MLKGKPQRIYWGEYAAPKFKFASANEDAELCQCGAYALHTLTKIPLKKLLKYGKNGHWGTRTMLRFLRERGYTVLPLTLGNVVEAHSVHAFSDKPKVTFEHVLLLGQHCFREESTWSVVYNNYHAHSGDVEPLDRLEFVNYPIEEAYVIFHPSWAKKRKN